MIRKVGKISQHVIDLRARWNDSVSLAALEECKQLENDPDAKYFNNMAELIADLESDDDES